MNHRETDNFLLSLAVNGLEHAAKQRLRKMTAEELRDLRDAISQLDEWLDAEILQRHAAESRTKTPTKKGNEMQPVISGGLRRHERTTEYEPQAPTADELKRAGITLLNVNSDGTQLALACDHCGQQWVSLIPRDGPPPYGYWMCPWSDKTE